MGLKENIRSTLNWYRYSFFCLYFTMGYDTVYNILIYAPTVERRVEIMKQIAVAASRPLIKEAAYKIFRKEIKKVEKDVDAIGAEAYAEVTFTRRGWDPLRDFRGEWYNKDFDMPREQGMMGRIEDGIVLKKGEKLEFDCKGDDDDDFWKATVMSRGFTYQRCDRVEYVNKKDKCDNVDEDAGEVCSGCGCCADIVPIYESNI